MVIEALVSLGFKSKEAKEIFNNIPKRGTLEEKIKHGIKYATSHKKKL